jgi:tetratricopeptide (TPR) repeat protein
VNNKRKYYIVGVLLVVLIFGLYFNILDNESTNWDDPALFSRTAIHEISTDNLKTVLAFGRGATYQPIRDLTYMLDFHFWGPVQNNVVFGMHLHNIVLYILMILACWLFLLELFKAFIEDEKVCFAWASLAAVLFAVHPVHVESVAWLYARKEPLLGIFTFISLWAFIRGRKGQWQYYLISGLGFVLAILSKPTAVMIPGVMIILDFALQARSPQPSFWKKRLAIYIPIMVLAVPMVIRLLSVMYSVGGVKPYHGGSFFTNLFAVSQILMSYSELIGFTINYSADYPRELYTDFRTWQAWVFVVLNIALIASAILAYVKKRYIYAIFVAWYYLFLLPVSHIFPISQILADRYAFLSSLSWCVLLGFLLTRLMYTRLSSDKVSAEFPKLIAVALVSVVVLSYSYMTVRQNDIWQNSQVLWEDTLAKHPNSSPANVNLSAIYLGQGRFRDVQELCIAAIKAKPYDYLAISNLALAQLMMKQYEHSINNYQQALKLKADLPKAKMGLAMAYWGIGDYENASKLYLTMIRQGYVRNTHQAAQYYYRLGYASWKLNREDDAYAYLNKALKMAVDRPLLMKDIGMVYTSMGDIPRAKRVFREVLPHLGDDELKAKLAAILRLLQEQEDGREPIAQ